MSLYPSSISATNHIVGDDLRKLISDGYPMENVIATDIYPGQSITIESLI